MLGSLVETHNADYGFTGYAFRSPPDADAVEAARRNLVPYLQPCGFSHAGAELTRVRLMVRGGRQMSDRDVEAQLAIYARELERYPADVVTDACRAWVRRSEWWPSWKELLEILDRSMKRRAKLAKALGLEVPS